jgi:hypothetical protein
MKRNLEEVRREVYFSMGLGVDILTTERQREYLI